MSRRLDPSCLSRYLKRSYLVNLSKYRVFLICNSALDFIWFICSKKFYLHRTTLLCLHALCMKHSEKFTFDYLGKNKPRSHFTRSGIIAHILNRQMTPNVLITIDPRKKTYPRALPLSFRGGDISCKILSFVVLSSYILLFEHSRRLNSTVWNHAINGKFGRILR